MLQAGGSVRVFGIELTGISAGNGRKLLASLLCIAVAWALAKVLRLAARALLRGGTDVRAKFWSARVLVPDDNWLELPLRFIARDHGVRELKDAMSRDILRDLKEAGIDIASATYEITGLPPLRVRGIPAPQPER